LLVAGSSAFAFLTEAQSRLKKKTADVIDEGRRAVSGRGVPASEAPGEEEEPSQSRAEATTTTLQLAASIGGPGTLEIWEGDPETPVIMPPPSLILQEAQSNGHSRAASGRSNLSKREEPHRHRNNLGHSQSRSRTSSAIDSSSHQSRREIDLFSSDAQQQRRMRSSGQRTDAASSATRVAEDLSISDSGLESQPMLDLSQIGSAFPNVDGVENTAHRPDSIDSTHVLPTRSTDGSTSTESYVRSLGT